MISSVSDFCREKRLRCGLEMGGLTLGFRSSDILQAYARMFIYGHAKKTGRGWAAGRQRFGPLRPPVVQWHRRLRTTT